MREQGMILLEVLPEAEARVEHDPVPGDARVDGASDDIREIAFYGADYIHQCRKAAPLMGASTSVHEDGAAAEAGDGLRHGVVPGEAADVVHDLATGLNGRARDRSLIRVDGEDCVGTFALDARDDRQNAAHLLLGGDDGPFASVRA